MCLAYFSRRASTRRKGSSINLHSSIFVLIAYCIITIIIILIIVTIITQLECLTDAH